MLREDRLRQISLWRVLVGKYEGSLDSWSASRLYVVLAVLVATADLGQDLDDDDVDEEGFENGLLDFEKEKQWLW